MAYISGSANNLTSLMSAISNALTENGWTLDNTVFHAGDCNVILTPNLAGDYIEAEFGTGRSGSAVTGPGPVKVRLQPPTTSQLFNYPITYFIEVYADEVFILVKYGGDRYCHLMFGQSPVAGLPGTGVWFCASVAAGNPRISTLTYNSFDGLVVGSITGSNASAGPFFTPSNGSPTSSYLHHGLTDSTTDPNGWSMTGIANAYIPGPVAVAAGGFGRLFSLSSPNAWNQEALLVPIAPYIARPSSKSSIIGQMKNIRYIRLDNLNPEQTISYGTDTWKVYPFYRKDTSARNGGASLDHSGTLGMAIRYDGG